MKLPLKKLKPGMGLYQVFYWPKLAPDKSKPYALANLQTGEVDGRWHKTKDDALRQARQLYSILGSRAKVHNEQGVVISVKSFSDPEGWIDGNKKWIKMYPYSSWTHPLFTDTSITPEIGTKMVKNFHDKVFGDKDLVITYDHGLDPAKGGKAAGWVREMETRDDGIYQLIEFTEPAKTEILDGEWRYFSGEHLDSWTHPQRQETFEFVPHGGALTNKPYVRDGILPLNFSDVFVEREDPSGSAESGGHMENDVVDEHADLEHSEAGTVLPRIDERNDDDSADSGSRLDPLPTVDDETESSVDEARLRELLGLGADGSIEDAVDQLIAEVTPIREAVKMHSEVKSFSEMFPEQAAELEQARKERIETRAKAFSDQFVNLSDTEGKPTGKGYPAVVLDKLAEVHKKFSEKVATTDDLTDLMETIGRVGLVPYGENGSTRDREDTSETQGNPAKAFSDKVAEIMTADSLDVHAASSVVAEKHPDLYEAYRMSIPGRGGR